MLMSCQRIWWENWEEPMVNIQCVANHDCLISLWSLSAATDAGRGTSAHSSGQGLELVPYTDTRMINHARMSAVFIRYSICG